MATKFSDFKYERPDLISIEKEFNLLLTEFKNGKSANGQYEILKKINVLRGELESLNKIASIRYTINTEDKFYSEEHDYLDDVSPVYSGIVNRLYKSLLESEFRSELENMCGEQLFNIVNVSLKTFSPDIVEDLKKENQLVSKYVKLIASAKIIYDGEERNIAGMAPFLQSENREVRKSSYDARLNFFENNENELDTIFDDLVKVRTK
ncbi:MAG: M3 family oligoendopeptidase, partial [Ignavibacteria bacterium]|nr:M3 family oligoendopeptidase [Ignavibacteria bacterium]